MKLKALSGKCKGGGTDRACDNHPDRRARYRVGIPNAFIDGMMMGMIYLICLDCRYDLDAHEVNPKLSEIT